MKQALGRPRKDIDPEAVANLARIGMSRRQVAAALGISKSTFYNRCAESEEIDIAFEQGRAATAAEVGNKLMELVREGNLIATIFAAKCFGWREDGKSDSDDEVVNNVHVYLPDNGR